MRRIRVKASKSYDVLIGNGILDDMGKFAKEASRVGLAAVITDDIVDALYGERLQKAIEKSGFDAVKYVFPHGEASKSAENYIEILNFLADNRFTRADTVFALGGGVVGDISGFAAATYMRGMGFVQVPTTLLAAVDSSVGGKTAIDLSVGKNLAGAFYQPDLVLCDYALLSTLPPDEMKNGLAEAIKCGIIADSELFRVLRGPVQTQLEEVIARCVELKRDIVERDERECGERKKLNLGHTVGHAIEKLSGYAVPHGHAVATGMAVISKAAARRGFCSAECRDEIISMLQSNGFETEAKYGADELWSACLSDKKRSGETITLAVPEKIGSCALVDISVEELREFIRLGVER